jgi:predicted GNAT superfamily acetyltransferase
MTSQLESGSRREEAPVVIRECTTVEEYDACVLLQKVVFGHSDAENSPRRHFIVTKRAGGWTLGAFVEDELVGFVHQMVAVRGREIIGYSHMMAVAAAYQNKGVGARLKWAQRERALAEGTSFITWTWDPMMARNAHFNINRLGVTARSYGVNFYGTDYHATGKGPGAGGGIASDRLFADWDLSSARVCAAAAAGHAPRLSAAPARTIEIPSDWRALLETDTETARREQLRVREEFQQSFAEGLVCAAFVRDAERPRYLLYHADEL